MCLLPLVKDKGAAVYVKDNNVVHIGQKPPASYDFAGTFSGISVVTERLLGFVPEQGFSSIIDAYHAALSSGLLVKAFVHEGYWSDIGDLETYQNIETQLLTRFGNIEVVCTKLSL